MTELQHPLVPMPLAARMVYERAYGSEPPERHLAERLNGLAYCLASLGPLYALESPEAAPRALSSSELAWGHFRNGGGELHFLDERAPILHVGVTRDCIERAIAALVNQAASR